ncbi:HicB-like protein involved in pilus formation [Isoptericola sp. CG 20/1183]|uniref:HicB-like protein involved in pilus formation n=1 Tax=Isoptericola halotolerans TaxID=300560 RepID=A0ABX5EH87_9MICO|nr:MULTISPECIES: toxin-antitoxin system HicB family antitoxin [Isoptericola]PRZ08854.1 HicB-like protein involved in pilus formation [Isoptericola halotolerans]PRZ10699.1 HicB-like protein involved in pilus formation [Isoptericola sp. CG 20/1183]
MDLTRYTDQLQQQLRTAASAGSDEAREIASRLTAPLDSAARLVLLEALSDAAGEISAELAPGSVDVRLRGGSPEFVIDVPAGPTTASAPEPAPPVAPLPDADGGATTRTTLRLPDHLKAQVETAAAREGVSVNTWLVRAVAGALEQSTGRPAAQARATHRGTSRATGWVR